MKQNPISSLIQVFLKYLCQWQYSYYHTGNYCDFNDILYCRIHYLMFILEKW